MTRQRTPTFCLVTDRRRIAPAARTLDAELRGLEARIAVAVEAGVDLVQLRERDLDGRRLVALARSLAGLTRGTGTRLLVNDRADVAVVSGADGVHLRGSGPAAGRVRALLPPGATLSRALHAGADVAGAAAGADLVVYGTVRRTVSKPDTWRTTGFEGLARAVAGAGTIPVLGIGGIGWGDMPAVAATGAAGAAGIGLFLADTARDAAALHERLRTARACWRSGA